MQVDKTATANNVRNFLGPELKKNLQCADMQFKDLEKIKSDQFPAELPAQIVYSTKLTVDHCSGKHRIILKRRYFKRFSDENITTMMGCSQRSYMYKKKDALLEFADRYKTFTKNIGMKPIDLHIYAL